jgi:hypothetical protein
MTVVQVCVGMYWPLMWTMKAKVLPLIAAALRLRLADVDADALGYSRGRARHRAQPVQVKHRQLREITSSRHARCARSPPHSLCRVPLNLYVVTIMLLRYNPECLSYRVCLSPLTRGTYLDQTHVLCVACAALALAAVLQVC